jgi:glycosyltransferase involved in cell wall biosynthesis
MSGLRVALIAPPWVAVPPPQYGGTEQVIDQLARGLTAAGHDVWLFTTGDSTCPVERRWWFPAAVGTTGHLVDALTHVEAAYDALAEVAIDVVHDHTLLGPLWALANDAPPVVTTVHGALTPPLARLYRSVGRRVSIVAISQHQRRSAPDVPIGRVIHHGIDVESFPLGRGDGGYVAFVGRMHPDKGAHRAIDIARSAGKRLLIAAKMWEPAERQYFAEQIEPRLGPDVTYLGEIGGADKQRFLADAEALLNPIRWPEPFGLVMVEALAAGTPVVTADEGAAPEIVADGLTGFVCRSEEEMAARLREVPRIDRRACRRHAEAHFSTPVMVHHHLRLYRELLADRRSRAAAPIHPTLTPGGCDVTHQTNPQRSGLARHHGPPAVRMARAVEGDVRRGPEDRGVPRR